MMRRALAVVAILLAASAIGGCSSDGKDGASGSICTVAENADGSATITCDDGTSVTVTDGSNGTDGTDGTDGANGADGSPGADGADGLPGADGADGLPGLDGLNGADGLPGLDGVDGLPGLDGVDGLPGVDGVPGVDGIDGIDGVDGVDGQDGASCSAVDNGDGTYTITCGADVVTLGDGSSCTVVNNGNGTATVSCEDGTSTTFAAPAAVSPVKLTVVLENVVFGVDAANFLTASFRVTDGTLPITGLTTGATTLYLAGLVPGLNGNSDEWQYWTGVNDVTLLEDPPGTYLLTSNKLTTDAPAGTTLQRGVARVAVTNFNTAVSTYDFDLAAPGTPVAPGKDVVADESCKSCHGFGVTIHSYGRNDTKVCVVCHSPNYNATIAPHEADMATMIHQIHTNKATTLGALHVAGHGENWPTLAYPGTILNCEKCHNTVAAADNWMNKPTMAACDSCHTTIRFDGTAYTGIKNVPGTPHTAADNSSCVMCHIEGGMAPVSAAHMPLARDDASQRLVEATITSATVDVDGGVTVAFSVTEAGAPKLNVGASGTSFTLAKLVPSEPGKPSYWQSYLSKVRTKNAAAAPVIQGRTESASADLGILTNNNDGTYTYKFKLLNAEVFNVDGTGDIRTIAHAHNNSSGILGDYLPANGLTQMAYPVPYEPALTHRIAIMLTGIKSNPYLDFVPAGTPAETRNIVTRASCDKCHGDSQLHAAISIEACVGCHNQNSFDPFSGPTGMGPLLTTDTAPAGTSSVELERLVHKIHMGKDLTFGYVVNGTHDYSAMQFPWGNRVSSSTPNASDCTACHDDSNAAMTESKNWQVGTRACGSCHDGILSLAHIQANTVNDVATCALCHAPGGVAPVPEIHGLQ